MSAKISVIIGFCLLLAVSSFAQTATGSLGGTIESFVPGVVPNAEVAIRLKSAKESFTKTTTSSETGEFNFVDLPAGVYEIEIKASNGSSYKRGGFRVTAGESLKYTIEFGTDYENDYGKKIELSETEKAEIVNQILQESLTKKQIPDYSFLTTQSGAVILSSQNINPEWVRPLANVKLLTAGEIQQKADKSGDFMYVSFTEFKISNECLIVAVATEWAIAQNSKDEYRYGGGSKYIYRKESGKIIRRMIISWIR